MTVYKHFIESLNKAASKTNVQLQPLSIETVETKKPVFCPEINSVSTIDSLINTAKTCLAGPGIITSVTVIGIIVTKLSDLAMTIIRQGSEARNWKDFFTILCSFLKEIIAALSGIGILNQALASEAVIGTLVQVVIGKLSGWLLHTVFWQESGAVIASDAMKKFVRDLLGSGPNGINNFCQMISSWTEAEIIVIVEEITNGSKKIAHMVLDGWEVVKKNMSGVDLRPALILAMLATIGITAVTGGFSAPITATAAALIAAAFVLLGYPAPTREEIENAWNKA
jgi:hypothetical protein